MLFHNNYHYFKKFHDVYGPFSILSVYNILVAVIDSDL